MVDLFEVAQKLRQESPEDFQTLVEVPGSFSTIDFKRDITVYLYHQKHHIILDYFGRVSHV